MFIRRPPGAPPVPAGRRSPTGYTVTDRTYPDEPDGHYDELMKLVDAVETMEGGKNRPPCFCHRQRAGAFPNELRSSVS